MAVRDILEVARLIRVLEDDRISKDEKIDQIKIVRDNGDITKDEALELALDYFGSLKNGKVVKDRG